MAVMARAGWTVNGSGDYDLIEQVGWVEDSMMHVIFACYPISLEVTIFPGFLQFFGYIF